MDDWYEDIREDEIIQDRPDVATMAKPSSSQHEAKNTPIVHPRRTT